MYRYVLCRKGFKVVKLVKKAVALIAHQTFTNSTHFAEDLRDLESLVSRPAFSDRYTYNENLTFAGDVNTLLVYSALVTRDCKTEDCRYYTYCTKVGYNIVCLSIRLSNFTQSLAEELNITRNPVVFKDGYIFDEDEMFAIRSESLLDYSTHKMRACSTRECRAYFYCKEVDDDDVGCISVFFAHGKEEIKEIMDFPILFPGFGDLKNHPVTDNEEFINIELEKSKVLLESNELKSQSKESKEDEDEK
ncbi:uncharacterized protein ACNLHF_021045 [Anomaloglossus baeobatrachus]|uniref:uncharacterized protein LOC142312665 n=1 Tax=Anomaloglossus baeobatrachus TaxID=238106 RepID=UPI003F4FB095